MRTYTPEQLDAVYAIYNRPSRSCSTCCICNQAIIGALEVITEMGGGRNTAHFYCRLPQGVEDHALALPEMVYALLTRLSPERARYFYAERVTP